MLKKLALGAVLALSVSGMAQAAEGCGEGFWRGPGGFCHPMANNRACPVGWHLGPEGMRCLPNGGFERQCPPGFHIGPEGRRCWPN